MNFLNYENTTLLSPSSNDLSSTTVTTDIIHPIQQNSSSIFISNTNDTNWHNVDLLELDHRYNSININNLMQNISNEKIPQRQEEQQQQIITNTTSQTDSDFEDKNLSWLFNFKLDELPHLSPEVNRKIQIPSVNNNNKSLTPAIANKQQQSKLGKKIDELILEVTSCENEENDMNTGENVITESNFRAPKKPPFTYTELIEYALEDKGELTVSGIYQWISDRFPFYKSNDDRWKNSVRHNLSINPHFRKGVKAPQGAGHLWTISSRDSEENALAWEHKKQRLELFFRMENSKQKQNYNNNSNGENSQNDSVYDEAATAAANLIQQLQNEDDISPSSCSSPTIITAATTTTTTTTTTTIAEEAITTGTGTILANTHNNHDHHQSHNHYQHHNHHESASQILSDINDELQKAAGEILNGVRRNVEVQSLNSIHHSSISSYHDSLLDTEDYLNPINKDDVVLGSSSSIKYRHIDVTNDYYVTEIDPIELGINMSNVEEEVLFNDDFNLNYFGMTPSGNDIMA